MATKVTSSNWRNFKNMCKSFLLIMVIGIIFGGESAVGFIIGLNLVGIHLVVY